MLENAPSYKIRNSLIDGMVLMTVASHRGGLYNLSSSNSNQRQTAWMADSMNWCVLRCRIFLQHQGRRKADLVRHIEFEHGKVGIVESRVFKERCWTTRDTDNSSLC